MHNDPEDAKLRLKSVELAIEFSKDKAPTVKDFQTIITNIYTFLNNK